MHVAPRAARAAHRPAAWYCAVPPDSTPPAAVSTDGDLGEDPLAPAEDHPRRLLAGRLMTALGGWLVLCLLGMGLHLYASPAERGRFILLLSHHLPLQFRPAAVRVTTAGAAAAADPYNPLVTRSSPASVGLAETLSPVLSHSSSHAPTLPAMFASARAQQLLPPRPPPSSFVPSELGPQPSLATISPSLASTPSSPAPPRSMPPSPPMPLRCEQTLEGKTDVSEWGCPSLDGKAKACAGAYVARSDGSGHSVCEHSNAASRCTASSVRLTDCSTLPPPPPPSPPPPSPPQPVQLLRPASVDEINGRFENGLPTDDMERAGLLVHTFDDMADTVYPWRPCAEGRWCGGLRDRMAATLIRAAFPDVYTKGDGGFVIRSSIAKVLCSYHGDGHSMAKTCSPPGLSERCTPGCPGSYQRCDTVVATTWCDCPRTGYLCAWRPNQLEQMMNEQEEEDPNGFFDQKGYNEVRNACDAHARAVVAFEQDAQPGRYNGCT